VYLIWRLRGRKIKDPNLPPRWGLLLAYAYLAGLTHILLDFSNNYACARSGRFPKSGIPGHRFHFRTSAVCFLASGLTLPALFSLIDTEIGARPRGPRGRLAATIALVGVVMLWGVRDYEHRRL